MEAFQNTMMKRLLYLTDVTYLFEGIQRLKSFGDDMLLELPKRWNERKFLESIKVVGNIRSDSWLRGEEAV